MINAYLVDDLKIIHSNGEDEWGEPFPDTIIDVKGYIVWKTKLIRNIKGEEVVSSGSIILNHMDIIHADMIEIAGIKYAILDIVEAKDFSSRFLEVFLA